MIEIRYERDRAARQIVRSMVKVALVAALVFAPAYAAFADDAEAESSEAEAEVVAEASTVGEPMPCSALSQQRYPFLSCVRSASGAPVFATEGPGQSSALLQIKSKFVAGAGAWGDSGIE